MKHAHFIIIIGLFLFILPVTATAHKVTVFAWIEGKTIHTQSKFSGGKQVRNGKIDVYNHLNQKVVEGVTDDKGYFTFPVPTDAKALNVILTAGTGHSNHWQITAKELGHKPMPPSKRPKSPISKGKATNGIDPDTFEAIVERVVEKKLAPLRAQLAEQTWGLRDIVAGIGYIIGLMGLASYIHHRKEKTAPPAPDA